MAACLLTTVPLSADVGAPAPSAKDLSKIVDEIHYVETAQPGIVLSGYVDVGYIYNFTDQASNTQGYGADGNARGDFSVNQVKLVLQKPLAGDPSQLEAGFRVDVMLGEDAAGFGTNPGVGLSSADSIYINNAYVELNLPYGNGVNVIAGKWGSLLGFEADERVDNLNITQGYNAALDPGPGTGVLFSYPTTDSLTLMAGVINGAGADTNLGITSAPTGDGYALTGGAAVANESGNAELQASFHWGPWGDAGVGAGQTVEEHILGLNLWGTWAPETFKDRLLLAFNGSAWFGEDYSAGNAAEAYAVALYSKYLLTDMVSLAGRFEYNHDADGQFGGFGGPSDVWG
jgi:hypothetical protein